MTSDRAILPEVIERYQRAHDARDIAAVLATFDVSASVTDDGETVRGHEAIRQWLEQVASEFTYQRTLLQASSPEEGHWLVVNNIAGNFPGGTVDLSYRFTVADDLIQELVISPVVAQRRS